MSSLSDLVSAADEWLRLADVPDYPQALNGLQLENSGEIRKVVAAVDACETVIDQACQANADLLVVHHGLFWNGAQKVTGPVYRKLKTAIDHDLAIYSAHIPLDIHPELGNDARLLLNLELPESVEPKPFFPWKGIDLGLRVDGLGWDREQLIQKIKEITSEEVHLCPAGPEIVNTLGIITGGAGSEIFAIAETGIDTFITGEGPHWSYTAAEELGINLIYAGHYQTETFGVRALARRWCDEFSDLEWEFIDHPTGL